MSSNVIEAAAGRRREGFAAIASASNSEDATKASAHLLSVSTDEAADVLRAPLDAFVPGTSESSAAKSTGGFTLNPFRDSDEHKHLFHSRSSDATSATAGEWDEEKTEAERQAGLKRIDAESAMWFVAVDTSRDSLLGLVFGEQVDDGDVDVAIWIRPEERKRGYGLSALKESRRELAAFFPGKHVIVRAPLAGK